MTLMLALRAPSLTMKLGAPKRIEQCSLSSSSSSSPGVGLGEGDGDGLGDGLGDGEGEGLGLGLGLGEGVGVGLGLSAPALEDVLSIGGWKTLLPVTIAIKPPPSDRLTVKYSLPSFPAWTAAGTKAKTASTNSAVVKIRCREINLIFSMFFLSDD
jgi:hypothetical protein